MPPALDEAAALPSAGFACDGGQPGQADGGRVAEGAQFGHFGQQVRGGVRRQTGDRGDDLGLAGERWLGGDELLDLGVNGAAMAGWV